MGMIPVVAAGTGIGLAAGEAVGCVLGLSGHNAEALVIQRASRISGMTAGTIAGPILYNYGHEGGFEEGHREGYMEGYTTAQGDVVCPAF